MFFTVYRTTNKVNGKYYFGVHKTNDPMDNYLGSGRWLKHAIAKYGAQNFNKEILLASRSPEAAFALEFELIEKHRGNPLCYNLRQGGSGGFDYINRAGLNGNNFVNADVIKQRVKSIRKKFESDPEYRAKRLAHIERIRSLASPEKRETARQKAIATWRGGKHTEQARQQMSDRARGNTSRRGFIWIYRDKEVKCINSTDLDKWSQDGWRRGKKDLPPKREKRRTKIELAPEGLHWCCGHQQYLPFASFHKDKNSPGGFKKYCIECRWRKRGSKQFRGRSENVNTTGLHPVNAG